MVAANEKQVAGDHYQSSIQTWDYIIAHDLGYLEGNVIKYVTRYKKKNGVQDLEKALHYLQKLIEVENDRLERSRIGNPEARKGFAKSDLAQRIRESLGTGRTITSGEQAANQFPEARYKPTSLGDII